LIFQALVVIIICFKVKEARYLIMKRIPITVTIKDKFNCSVKDFLEGQKSQGNGLTEIAEILNCHPSSVRSIGFKNGVSFSEAANKEIVLCADSTLFKAGRLNNHNVLSRSWC
jgi:hypothetical protein